MGIDGVDGVDGDDSDGGEDDDGEPEEQKEKKRALQPIPRYIVNIQPFVEGRMKWRRGEINK